MQENNCIAGNLIYTVPHYLSLSLHRRAFDVERRLDRIKCNVTQYSDEGEAGVEPVINVVARVAALLPLSIPIFQNPVDVSGEPAACMSLNQVCSQANTLSAALFRVAGPYSQHFSVA